MNRIEIFALTAGLYVMSSSAHAISIDFKALAEPGGAIGESAWNTLMFDASGNHTTILGDAVLSITGTNGSNSFAYLDANNAGLGVCGALLPGAPANQVTNSGSNLCSPSNDDNVSNHDGTPESLHFEFTSGAVIDTIWFNNNHDGDTGLLNDYVAIGTNGSTSPIQLTNGGAGLDSSLTWGQTLGAGTIFDVGFIFDTTSNTCLGGDSFDNCEFYISKIEFSVVPVPAAAWLFGSGLLGLIGVARRKAA